MKTYLYNGYYLADRIDVKKYKSSNEKGLFSHSSTELYYTLEENRYLYVLSYGVVVFANFSLNEINERTSELKKCCRNVVDEPLVDDFKVHVKPNEQLSLTFNDLTVEKFDDDINKMIMLNIAQSVALDFYNMANQEILSEIQAYTEIMKTKGKIMLSQRETLKFIGKTLTIRNNIAENLYILDTPEDTWEDEYLDKLHRLLNRYFEFDQRYRATQSTLKILDDNLSIFIENKHHRESSRLEWIIIILIVIEVIETLITRFME